MSMTVDDDTVIQDSLVHAVGRSMEVVYEDDGLIGSREPEWLQGSLNVLIGLFLRIGLMTNVANYKKNDVSSRDDLIENVRGSNGMNNYGERRCLPGEATETATTTGLQGGINVEVDDRPPQAPEWNRNVNQLGPDTIQSHGEPTPSV